MIIWRPCLLHNHQTHDALAEPYCFWVTISRPPLPGHHFRVTTSWSPLPGHHFRVPSRVQYYTIKKSRQPLTRRGFSLRYGGSPSIISMAMMPSDQMSTRGPYCLRVTTSGAIQYGVPTIVERLLCSGDSCAQNPKSAANEKEDNF